ncbi:MAG: hypothetical protein AAFY01_01450 [Pseudomonadota bacterium]
MRRFLIGSLAIIGTLAATVLISAPASAQYGDARSAMSDLQRNALKDGCWKRYSGNNHKRYQCLNGQGYWRNALIDGCHARYSGNGSKLDRCLNMSNLGWGSDPYGGAKGYDPYGNDYHGNRHYGDDPYGGAKGYDPYGDNHHGNRPYRDGYGNDPYYGHQSNHGGYYGNSNNYGGGGYYSGGGGASGLTDIQQNALKDGCWQRYSGNDRKRHSCLNGQAHWRDALRDGCWKRYNGNQKKLNRCLSY